MSPYLTLDPDYRHSFMTKRCITILGSMWEDLLFLSKRFCLLDGIIWEGVNVLK